MSSDMFDIPIVFDNQEEGKIHNERYSILRKGTVKEISDFLNKKYPGSHVSLNNAMSQLQEDDIIEDVYQEEDVLTAVKQKHDIGRNGGRWVDNRSGDIVVLMGRNGKPSYLQPKNEQFWQIGFLDFYPKLVVFRKQYEKVGNETVEKRVQGERVFRGQKFKVPRDREINKVKIDNDGVYMITEAGNTVNCTKEDEEVEKMESVFYRPVGSKLPITFQNVDANSVHVINGGKQWFEAIEMQKGEQKKIDVKADYRAHHSFGVATAHLLSNGEREFTTTMFDICPGKMIKISKTSTGITASVLKVDDDESPLPEITTTVFRDSDRRSISCLVNWMYQGVKVVDQGIQGVSALLGGVGNN